MTQKISILIWVILLGLTACQATNNPMVEMRQSLAELTPLTGNAYVQKRDVFIDQYQTQLQSDTTQQQLNQLKPLTMDEQVVLLILQTRVHKPELFSTVHNYLEDNIPDKPTANRIQFSQRIGDAKLYSLFEFGEHEEPYYVVSWEYLWKEDALRTLFKEMIAVKILVGAEETRHPELALHVTKQLLYHTNDDVVLDARYVLKRYLGYAAPPYELRPPPVEK